MKLLNNLYTNVRDKVLAPRMISVESSAIAEVGYDRRRHSLLVRYRDKNGEPGRLYEDGCADRRVFRELLAADSKGRFVNKHVRTNGQLPFRRVVEA